SMQLGEIIRFQREHFVWNVFLLPLPFLIYVTASLAEIGRSPYDIAEAESEIVAGYHTEYSGMKFGLFYAVELVNALLVSGLAASMWYGGWYLFEIDRVVPGWLVFIGKMYALYFLLIWTRGTLPRLRIDQVMETCLFYLLPISCVLMAGVCLWQLAVPAEWGRWVRYLLAGLTALGLLTLLISVLRPLPQNARRGELPGAWKGQPLSALPLGRS
ncbi:MAG: NADH-quinone oxidoreductase subunit H, partial [Peptococcaceae bacterium]|nr:NADH-quinone oxidoreductase subunit H [Peptococcaceae bacterium]